MATNTDSSAAALESPTGSNPPRLQAKTLVGLRYDEAISSGIAQRVRLEVSHSMDNQVPQASIGERDRDAGKRSDTDDLREPGRRDSEGEYQSGPRAFAGERAAGAGGVQARAAHEGADVTAVIAGEPRVKQSVLGEASLGPRVFCGERRERDRRDDRPLHREPAGHGAGPRCRLQSRAVMSAPVGFSRQAQNPPPLGGSGSARHCTDFQTARTDPGRIQGDNCNDLLARHLIHRHHYAFIHWLFIEEIPCADIESFLRRAKPSSTEDCGFIPFIAIRIESIAPLVSSKIPNPS
jgi:hypothetical protein